MSKQKIKVVELQIDKGERKFDELGKYIGERQAVTFTYGDTQWENNVRNLKHLGAVRVEVKAAFGHTVKHKDEENPDLVYQNEAVDVSDELKAEVAKLFSNKKEVENSAEQKQIDELKAQIAALTNPQPKQAQTADANVSDLDKLHADFKAKFDRAVPVNKKNDVEWIKNELAK